MSLKDLFKEQNYKHLGNTSVGALTGSGIESPGFIEKYVEERERFIPLVDFSKPANFAKFGSAEKYYYDSIKRIYQTYPYDGSKKEKIAWELSSSHLDLYLFEKEYPRTTGYANFLVSAATSGEEGVNFYPPVSDEYILVKGGPHAGEGSRIYIDPDTGEAHFRKDANLYDLAKNRENNLLVDGTKGNTVEFWLKKDAYVADQEYFEFIFDSHVSGTSIYASDPDYGRLAIALATTGTTGNISNQPFYINYASGTTEVGTYIGSSTLTTASISDANWHHYAVRMKTVGSNTVFDLFVDGKHNDTATVAATIGYVSGSLIAAIGSQVSPFPAASANRGDRGWSPFSGSIDEFRYWKRWRTSKQIQTRWFDQVGGGTNTDDANTDLGVYFKFNEGITEQAATDSKVLDYSGRISNGTWIGYSSAGSRSTGSAINESGLATYTATEFNDPIVYAFHPQVFSFMENKRKIGKEYDYTNPSTIYYSMPSWLLEEHETSTTDGEGIIANSLLNLTQIISSYFDNVANLASSLPELAQNDYLSGSYKPIPFMNRILESKGFVAPDIFNAVEALEYFESRDDNTVYTEKVTDVKNIIYRNIYNNLTFINKSKGTEKSFRNLIRCFGIDDQVYKLNVYSNNVDYTLDENYRLVSEKVKLINFNTIENSDASVYQFSSSVNSNSTTFISASKNFDRLTSIEASLPFSVEANIIFPLRVDESQYNTLSILGDSYRNNYPLFLTSSLFGMHTARDSEPEDTTWDSNDYANFLVKAIKPKTFSNKAKFVLTGTDGGFMPELSSPYIDNIYDDSNWSFLVSLYSEKYPNQNQIDGTSDSDVNYIVEFSGIRKVLDQTISQFTVTGTMTIDEAVKFLASPKRTFIGAHRTNFTGSLLLPTDIKFNNFRVWQNKLTMDDISVHASDPSNYSIKNPEQNAFLFNETINKVYIPNKETLLLNWDFATVTGSDASGQFIVEDLTSGSLNQKNRYGYFSNIVNKQYTGIGYQFKPSSDVVISDDVAVSKPNMPETLTSEDTVKVLTNDDIYFYRDKRPTFFDLYIEKSPYQNISEEMLKFMSTTVDYNNLIGRPIERYRSEYKSIKVLRQMFFQRMDAPNIDKYVEYFKWFDLAVSAMIQKLAPMSSGLEERPLRNIIESHILERNKYQTQFPTYEFKQSDPEATLFGINELTYPWKEGHAPLNAAADNQNDNCVWFKERAERDGIISSGDATVDSDREEILNVINNQSNATLPNLSGSAGTYQGSAYALRRFARPYKINAVKQKEIHGGGNGYENKKVGFWDSLRKRISVEGGLLAIEPPDSKLELFKDCDDGTELNKGKKKYTFSVGVIQDGVEEFTEIYKGDMAAPFTLYSSSLSDNPAMADLEDFQANLAITNLHHDSYGPFNDVPMQGPFTEKYVGGRSYRHVMTNLVPNNENPQFEGNRMEGWRLTASAGLLEITNVSAANPKSVFFREEYAKRPVNIKNIQQLTSSNDNNGTDGYGITKIGNYSKTYEIVMTQGRSTNNRYLAESDGDLASTSAESTAVSGVIDFAIPRRDLTGSNKAIIVNRFSAPGDPATMGEGMLDVAAGEYSVYNALPFRNLSVRMPLNELQSDHTNQFGLFSDAKTVADYENYNAFHSRTEVYPGGSSSIDDTGADLNYIGTGSFHKVNRNGRKQIVFSGSTGYDDSSYLTDVKYDNFFVQHQIPQTDVQYAWITASLVNNYTGSALYDFEKPDFSNASLASTDLSFLSRSDFGVMRYFGVSSRWGTTYDYFTSDPNTTDWIPVDFAGLNTIIYENLTSSTNTLVAGTMNEQDIAGGIFNDYFASSDGFIGTTVSPAAAVSLNGLLLHRQGPYGGANWKLYRKDNHPIARAHRSENRLSYLTSSQVIGTDNVPRSVIGISSVIEPPITSKYKQLSHFVIYNPLSSSVEGTVNPTPNQTIRIDHSYMNNIRFFTEHETENVDLDGTLLSKRNTKSNLETLDVINYYLTTNDLDEPVGGIFNPIKGLEKYITRETIFPREQYTYSSLIRQRENFQNGFWRSSEDDRRKNYSEYGYGLIRNPYGFNNATASQATTYNDGIDSELPLGQRFTSSIWSLDGRLNYEQNSPGRIKSSSDEREYLRIFSSIQTRPAISGGSDGAGILQNSFYPYANYGSYKFFVGGTNFNIAYAPVLPQYNRRIAGIIPSDTVSEYKFGDNKWEAAEQADKSPFYDSYDQYLEDIKGAGKDYGLVPEFRISEHIDSFINSGYAEGFLRVPPQMLEITGTSLQNSDNDGFFTTYSNSDFLKTFSIVSDMYGDKSQPTKVTLSAKAIKKLLPYDGFYPADRTVQLAKLFHESYASSFAVEGNIVAPDDFGTEVEIGDSLDANNLGFTNPIWKSLFAPGILYNSIKSGIAVDYPVHTTDAAPVTFTGTPNQRTTSSFLRDIPRITKDFDFRVPFEALLDPEGAFDGRLIVDSEPHPSASANLTASIAIASKENYKLAMNNFLASTIDFFLPNGELTTIRSEWSDMSPEFGQKLDPDTNQVGFQVGKEYRMRLVCNYGGIQTKKGLDELLLTSLTTDPQLFYRSASYDVNSPSCVMYAQTGALSGDLNKTADYYGSAFGPPCDTDNLASGGSFDFPSGRRNYGSASYEPFTPSYYNGYGHIEYIFRPTDPSDYVSVPSIMELLTESYQRSMLGNAGAPRTPGVSSGAQQHAQRNAMVLSASINKALATEYSITTDEDGNIIGIDQDPSKTGYALTFQPKWETPILNFKDVDVTLPITGSGSAARGMWHQYGTIPSSNEGIFLQIQDLTRAEKDNATMTGSLAIQLGLSKDRVQLGQTAENKKISEAVVAIPYYVNENGDYKRFAIPKGQIDTAKKIVEKKNKGIDITVNSSAAPDDSIVDMVDKMQRFVLPPYLDFVTNPDAVDPFAMFIFEFSVNLTRQDLADIWQNLRPNTAALAKQTEQTASLPVDIFERISANFSPDGKARASILDQLPDNTRWMVFKIKQRSAINYYKKTISSVDDEKYKFNFKFNEPNVKGQYSYNWPYDFFSLVELVKIDAEIESTINPIEQKLIKNEKIDKLTGIIEPGGTAINAPTEGISSQQLIEETQATTAQATTQNLVQQSESQIPGQAITEAAAPGGSPTGGGGIGGGSNY